MDDFSSYDLVGLADGIRDGLFSSEEVTKWSLARMETLGRRFNAVFRLDSDLALCRARCLDRQRAMNKPCGLLHGVPLAHKDMFDVDGLPSHAGSLVLKGRVPTRSAFAIEQMNNAGQVNVGSLHMAEFALSPTGYNAHYGSGENPWNSQYISGGSSSGSAISVAIRAVFGSLGGDTGGSIRLPAAICGVTGIKPTLRRVSSQGVVPLSFSLDCVGPIAQSARDCARLMTCISRSNPEDDLSLHLPPEDFEEQLDGNLHDVRIGMLEGDYWKGVDDEVATRLHVRFDELKECGASTVIAHAPDLLEDFNALAQIITSVEAATLHHRWIRSQPENYSDQVRGRIEQGFGYSAVTYAEALSLRHQLLKKYVDSAFANCDVLYAPIMPILTPTIAETTEGTPNELQTTIGRVGQLVRWVNYLGLPAIAVPAGLSKAGLPIAYQLIGKPFTEGLLLKVADAYQRQSNWHHLSPFNESTMAPKAGGMSA